eukprot:XP_011454550.1 PREDICTED: monocarboxylate transporter 13 isoform X2 [Crassostrea gigas]
MLHLTSMTSNPTSSNHPVDKGWAWVILAGSSLIFMIYVGTLKTSGLFFVAFQDYYKSEAFTTSIIPGILQIVYSIASLPILTVGLDHLSARQMIIIGGFLGSIAYFIGFFADRIEILIFTHGVLYGIGCATIHGPTAYLIGLYFNRRRELANSVLVASSGFGGLVVPPLYRYLLDVYGLRGTMLIFSGVILHVVALAGLLKPPSLFHHPSNSNEKSKPEYSNVEIPDTHGYLPVPTGKKRSISLSEKPTPGNGILSSFEKDKTWGSLPHRLDIKAHHSSRLSESFRSLGSTNAVHSFSQSQLNESQAQKDVQHKIIDISLLKKPLLQMYLFVYLFGSIGSSYGHIYISPFARDHGMTTTEVSILVSVTNMCDFIGRGLCGVIANQRIVKNSTIVAISQFVTGATLALCSFYGSFWSFIALAVMFGLFAGAIFSMTPSIVVDFVGIENFRTAFGILILGQGITMGTGAPLLGYLRDVSLSYIPSFYFMGACLILSGLTLLMEPCVRKRQDKMEVETRPSEEVALST